jgi:DNA-binding NarL/FixJ family response regulator
MSVRPEILTALAQSLRYLRDTPQRPIPANVIAALADVAKPGTALKIDLDASAAIGAPLVTVTEQPQSSTLLADLTPRQRHVANLVIDGRSNKQIAAALEISVATVKDHVHAILQRLDLPSRGAVIAASHASRSA